MSCFLTCCFTFWSSLATVETSECAKLSSFDALKMTFWLVWVAVCCAHAALQSLTDLIHSLVGHPVSFSFLPSGVAKLNVCWLTIVQMTLRMFSGSFQMLPGTVSVCMRLRSSWFLFLCHSFPVLFRRLSSPAPFFPAHVRFSSPSTPVLHQPH